MTNFHRKKNYILIILFRSVFSVCNKIASLFAFWQAEISADLIKRSSKLYPITKQKFHYALSFKGTNKKVN